MSQITFTLAHQTIYPEDLEANESIPKMAHLVTFIGIDCLVPKNAFAYDHLITSDIINLAKYQKAKEKAIEEEEIVEKALKVIYPRGPKATRLKYSYDQLKTLFHWYYVEDVTAIKASDKADINPSTAGGYISKVNGVLGVNPKNRRGSKSAVKAGGSKKLLEQHSQFLSEYYENDEFAMLKEAYSALRLEFEDLDVADSTIYSHLRKRCCLAIKPIDMEDVGRIDEQYSIIMDDIDFLNSCVYFTIKGFYMYERESFGWSRSAAGKIESTLSEEGGIFFSLMAAFCDYGVIDVSLKTTVVKDRKNGTTEALIGKKHNVYSEFMDSMLDTLSKSKIKKQYIVVDGINPKHVKGVEKIIETFGYKFLYVKHLSAADQFWSKLKRGIPRHHVDHNNCFVPRVKEAVKEVSYTECIEWISQIDKEALSG